MDGTDEQALAYTEKETELSYQKKRYSQAQETFKNYISQCEESKSFNENVMNLVLENLESRVNYLVESLKGELQ